MEPHLGYYLIFIVAGLVSVAALAIAALFVQRNNKRMRAIAVEFRGRFFSAVLDLRQKRDELSEYTPEYYHAFKAGGWAELNEMLDALAYVEGTVDLHIAQRRFKEVLLLCRYLLGEVEGEEQLRASITFAHLKQIEDWKTESRALLVQLSKTVGAAAHETRKLGVDRSRRRKSTLDAIAEILAQDPS